MRVAYSPDLIGPPDELSEILCEAAAAGYSLVACAAKADITRSQLAAWLKKGRDARDLIEKGVEVDARQLVYAGFAERMERAQAKGALALEDLSTERANKGNSAWSEAFRKLERQHPDDWADKTRLKDGGGGGIQIVIAGGLEPRVAVRELPDADAEVRAELPAASSADEISQ